MLDRAGCPGLCAARFCISLRMKSPLPVWATCSSVQPPNIFKWNFLHFSLCPLLLSLSLGIIYKCLASPYLLPSAQVFLQIGKFLPTSSLLQDEQSAFLHRDSKVLLCTAAVQLMYWCVGLFLPRCRTLHSSLWNFMRFPPAHLSGLSRFL